MTKPALETGWSCIKAHEGERFRQIRGREFTYPIRGAALVLNTTNQNLPRAQFERACALVPLPGATPIQRLRGPSYLYAVLTVARVRQAHWRCEAT
jgi:hypothetical protein